MKKLIVLLIATIVSVGSMYAQDYDERAKLREERRAEQERLDSLNYEIAKQAISEKKYVLEADRLCFKRGETVYVTPTTNFVAVDNNEATVQLAFNGPFTGPNGIGGITVDGTVTNYKYKENKKGNIFISMNVMGTGISAQVTISLPKGSSQATVTVTPNFNSNRISLQGIIVPKEQSRVFKGTAL